ncbi:bifunctional Zinc finger [Babesia duncani]|uniref:Bifunctional Zinc finger n=1 Tax=Babesia duncani TaxID=323732 RepID=A0AAD9PNS4_9APIC|nr:bifunctional Zinc finger [Babesia duncani]
MSEYAMELVNLSRNHFNQILRYKHKVKPIPLPRIILPFTLHAKTLSVSCASTSSTGPSGRFGISFSFDCTKTTVITAHWGVPVGVVESVVLSKNEPIIAEPFTPTRGVAWVIKKLLFPFQGEHAQALLAEDRDKEPFNSTETLAELSTLGGITTLCTSESLCFDAGNRNSCLLEPPKDFVTLNATQVNIWDALMDSNDHISLVIVLHTPNNNNVTFDGRVASYQAYAQVTLVNFKRSEIDSMAPFKISVQKQIIYSGDIAPQESRDMFGMGDEVDEDCLICIANKMDTVLLPCGHSSFCSTCLAALRNEKCPVCRSEFESFVKLPLKPSTE